MYVSRTSEIEEMTPFETFYQDLFALSKKYGEKNVPIKIEKDLESDIIKIFGEKINALNRAKNGLNDVTELAYTTAEHHPYWNVLYHSAEIANSTLENWNKTLSAEALSDLEWALKKLEESIAKIKKQNTESP